MQVSELVRATSVPLATVKYYLREGLLPAARKITARSSEYGEEHVRRLTLLRMLREVGAIPVGRLRELVDAVDNPRLTEHEVFARASDAIASGRHGPRPGGRCRGPWRSWSSCLAAIGWTGVRRDGVDVGQPGAGRHPDPAYRPVPGERRDPRPLRGRRRRDRADRDRATAR